MKKDLRKNPRVRALGQYRISGKLNFPLELIDIAEGGAGVISHGPLDVGSLIEVDLYFPDGIEITTTVRVRWARRVNEGRGRGTYQAGLQFVTLSDEARQKIYQFVEKTDQASS